MGHNDDTFGPFVRRADYDEVIRERDEARAANAGITETADKIAADYVRVMAERDEARAQRDVAKLVAGRMQAERDTLRALLRDVPVSRFVSKKKWIAWRMRVREALERA